MQINQDDTDVLLTTEYHEDEVLTVDLHQSYSSFISMQHSCCFCCLLLFTKCFSLWQYIKVVKIEKWHKKLVGHYQAQIIQTLIWTV